MLLLNEFSPQKWIEIIMADTGWCYYLRGPAVDGLSHFSSPSAATYPENRMGGENMLGLIVRFVVSALVLMFVDFILPGFTVAGFVNALLAAVAIAIIGWLVESLLGDRISPQSRGFVGFLTAAVVIYLAQFVVPTMSVTIVGALLASLVIGIIDAVVPTQLR